MGGINLIAFRNGLAFARELDDADALQGFRSRFAYPDSNLIYMDGNSLGRLPLETVRRTAEIVNQEWGKDLIRSWNRGWYETPQRVGEKIARVVGSASGQVIVCDSTSINLFKLVMAALERQPGRHKIVTDDMNFPSDLYILQGCIRLFGDRHTLQVVPSRDGIYPDLDALSHAIDQDTALVTLSHVAFKSGYRYDASALAQHCHTAGALLLWDLSHSVGAVPVELDNWGTDLAVGCTYKYLNGGPGAPAFLYVRKDLQPDLISPIWGWFGQRDPFQFGLEYKPGEGMQRFLAGTPPILSLQAVETGVDLVLEAGIERLHQKSILMSEYMLWLYENRLASMGFALGSPRSPELRGSHVSLRHPEGYRINRALIEEMQVLPDFREPDNLRLGLAPLYTTFEEVYETVERLAQVVGEKHYLHYSSEKPAVT